MADLQARTRLPDLGETYDVSEMRELVRSIELEFLRRPVHDALIVGGGRPVTKYFSATVTWNPANVGNGAQTTTTVTVTGAKLAEFNTATAGFTKDLQGMRLTAYVSANDTVTVVLRNDTGGAINLDEGSLTVGVWRH